MEESGAMHYSSLCCVEIKLFIHICSREDCKKGVGMKKKKVGGAHNGFMKFPHKIHTQQ